MAATSAYQMYSNGLLLGGGYDNLRLRMEGCRGAEKFWSFGPKLPNRPPYVGLISAVRGSPAFPKAGPTRTVSFSQRGPCSKALCNPPCLTSCPCITMLHLDAIDL